VEDAREVSGADTTDPFGSARLGPLALRNRVIKAATFEGMCPAGSPSDALVDFHRRVAAGGVAMTTVAYCSVSPEGRTYGHQMWMRDEVVPDLRRLTDAVHAEGAAAALQLGHSGLFASRAVAGSRPVAPSRMFNTYGLSFSRPMDADDMARLGDDFARAATLSVAAGFDAIELHLGHGYLLSQFLSPATNRRRDDYGGSLANRLRFPLAVVDRVREALGPERALVAKMNLRDGFPGGLELDEAVEVARALEAHGVDAIEPSGGAVTRTPLYMLRGDVPLRDMVRVQSSRLHKVGLSLFGRLFVPHHPFEETFFLEGARRVVEAVDVPVVLLGGVRSVDQIRGALAEGFGFVALGRPLIHDPNLVNRMASGEITRSGCIPCNRCIAEMDAGGVRCVLPETRAPAAF
jgi:2,4-dienoyl-CoA reductase-like NADH-dependent reductase (Old Yellow Enzyme family)